MTSIIDIIIEESEIIDEQKQLESSSREKVIIAFFEMGREKIYQNAVKNSFYT